MKTPAPLSLAVIHGPNLNLLGVREPEIYGTVTLEEINERIRQHASTHNISVEFFQSNNEGAIIDFIHSRRTNIDGLVINPAAYTHTSVAILDALKAVALPAVEVHLSQVFSREEFRHHSITSAGCIGIISGFGAYSYILGIEGLVAKLSEK